MPTARHQALLLLFELAGHHPDSGARHDGSQHGRPEGGDGIAISIFSTRSSPSAQNYGRSAASGRRNGQADADWRLSQTYALILAPARCTHRADPSQGTATARVRRSSRIFGRQHRGVQYHDDRRSALETSLTDERSWGSISPIIITSRRRADYYLVRPRCGRNLLLTLVSSRRYDSAEAEERLREIGMWLAANAARSMDACRPIPPRSWGVTTQRANRLLACARLE